MSTTSTEFTWFWYVRKKGRRYYLGLVNENGDAPTGAYDIELYYDEVPDEITSNDDTIPIPAQFEMAILKGVAAELMAMSPSRNPVDITLRRDYERTFEQGVIDALHHQIEESQQPTVIKPLDLRDDNFTTTRE